MERKKVGATLAVLCVGILAFLSWNDPLPVQGQSRAPRRQAEKKSFSANEIDTQTSRVYIHVGATGFGHEHAVLGRVKSGEIRLGASEKAGRIVFDMAGFVSGTTEARRYIGLKGASSPSTARQVTANMLGNHVLNVRRFPTATFLIASALPLKEPSASGLPQYRLNGTFTLHGVTRSLKLTVEAKDKDGKVRLRGGFPVLQTNYGITPYSKAFGAVGVADRLTIYGEIDIARKARLTRKNSNRK